jgi:hypothetical protein
MASNALMVTAEYVNASGGYRLGVEPETEFYGETEGELFRFCLREYGRCISKVYVDRSFPAPDGNGKASVVDQVGWCFQKRVEYQDAHCLPRGKERTYLQEVWVTFKVVAKEN